MFKKGAKAGPGRPKGSKERRYLSLQFWFNQLERELAKKIVITRKTKDGLFVDSWETTAVDPNKRAQIFLEAMKMLTSKMKELPKTPDESVNNIKDMTLMLEEMSKGTNDKNDVKSPSLLSPTEPVVPENNKTEL